MNTAMMATNPSKAEPQTQLSVDSSSDLTFNTHTNSQNQPTSTTTPPTIMSLPTELHLLISSHLTYPDALSLKHTSRHFYSFVYTGVNLKVEWLIERRTLHLDCPHNKSCELGSDMRFCRGSVGLLMKRRREHGECDTRPDGRGCLVFGTRICTFPRRKTTKLEKLSRWMERSWIVGFLRMNVEVYWVLIAVIGLMLACCGSIWLRAGSAAVGV